MVIMETVVTTESFFPVVFFPRRNVMLITCIYFPYKELRTLPSGKPLHPCKSKNNDNFEKIFIFAPCINSIKAHNYKFTGILKQLKFPQSLRHVSVYSGTIIRELFRA